MELYQIHYIKIIAEYGNMSQAASVLNTTQPSLSRTLRKVEEELEIKLFDRFGKKLILNENGKKFCQYADKILKLYDTMILDLTPDISSGAAMLNIAVLHSNLILPNLIMDFSNQYPEITVNLQRFQSPSEVSDNCDFIIFASNHPLAPSVHVYRLFDEELKIGMSVQHPLADKPELTIDDLKSEQFLSLNIQNSMGQILSDFFESSEISPPILLHCDSQVTISALVSKNKGLALFPSETWSIEKESILLKQITGVRLMRTIYLEQRVSNPSQSAMLFKKFVLKQFPHHANSGNYPSQN